MMKIKKGQLNGSVCLMEGVDYAKLGLIPLPYFHPARLCNDECASPAAPPEKEYVTSVCALSTIMVIISDDDNNNPVRGWKKVVSTMNNTISLESERRLLPCKKYSRTIFLGKTHGAQN